MRSTHGLLAVLLCVGFGCGERPTVEKPSTTSDPRTRLPWKPLVEQGRVADDRSITAIHSALVSGDADARREAAHALGVAAAMEGDSEVIEKKLLISLKVEKTPENLAAVLWALGRAGSTESLDAMGRALASESNAVVTAAALSLGVFGRRSIALTDDLRAALVRLAIATQPGVRYAVTYALAREHEPKSDPRLAQALEVLSRDGAPEVRSTALTGLSRRRAGVNRMIDSLNDEDWRVSVAAVRGLLAIGGARAHGALEGWIRVAARDDRLRPHPTRVALEGLAEVAEKPAAQRVAKLLMDKFASDRIMSLDNGQILCLATSIWQRHGGDLERLNHCAGVSVPDWWRAQVVASSVAASTHLKQRERIAILGVLATDHDPRIRAVAMTAMARVTTGSDRAVGLTFFAKALADRSSAVAGSAADALASLGLSAAEASVIYKALLARTERELITDGELGLTLIAAIQKSRIEAGIPMCEIAAIHRNRTIRAAGIQCLGQFGRAVPTGPPLERAPIEPVAPNEPTLWTVVTSRGIVVIELEPRVAPRHVRAILQLSGGNFYDRLAFHRVVPDFVIQGGDPDGTGWGGPDFVIPAEPSPLTFERGTVGVADAGPDTGGSQWFVMHSRAPHLEGRYTRIGTVVSGMDVIDAITVGDRIERARLSKSPAASE